MFLVIVMKYLNHHTKKGDVWISIENKVYDISDWIKSHPGGATPLLQYAGRDMTDAFRAYHKPGGKADKTLKSYYIGNLASSLYISDHMVAFRNIVKNVEKDCKTDYTHYGRLFISLCILLCTVVYCVMSSGFWIHTLGAICLGFFWQQTLFIGHDAGHGAITQDYKTDAYIGLVVGNLLNGVSISWWNKTHNVHHCACNSLECDPDIQHMPVLAVSPKYFKSVYSLYHNRRMTFNRVTKCLVSIQHYTFYPIMAVARFNLYVQSFILLFTSKEIKRDQMVIELALLGMYFTWLFTLLHCLPSLIERVSFLLVSHGVSGIIHVQICLSHFSRNTFDGRPENNKWVDMQLSGTLDIYCHPWLDWFHGGLQFQTEHHIMPRMPRHKLRKFREEVVVPFCHKFNLQHDTFTFWEANVQVWKTLKVAADMAKISPIYSHAVNLRG